MTVDHESSDPYEYNPEDIQGLPEFQNLGGGIKEYNTQYETDVREVIESAAHDGERLTMTVFDSEGLAYDLFDKGYTASVLEGEMDKNGWDVGAMVEYYSNGKIDPEEIVFYQIHESKDWSDLV